MSRGSTLPRSGTPSHRMTQRANHASSRPEVSAARRPHARSGRTCGHGRHRSGGARQWPPRGEHAEGPGHGGPSGERNTNAIPVRDLCRLRAPEHRVGHPARQCCSPHQAGGQHCRDLRGRAPPTVRPTQPLAYRRSVARLCERHVGARGLLSCRARLFPLGARTSGRRPTLRPARPRPGRRCARGVVRRDQSWPQAGHPGCSGPVRRDRGGAPRSVRRSRRSCRASRGQRSPWGRGR